MSQPISVQDSRDVFALFSALIKPRTYTKKHPKSKRATPGKKPILKHMPQARKSAPET